MHNMTCLNTNNALLESTLHLNSGDSSLFSGDYSPSITSYELALNTLSKISSENTPTNNTSTITLIKFRIHYHSAVAYCFEEDYVSALRSATYAKLYSGNIPTLELGGLFAVIGEVSYFSQQHTDSLKAFTTSLSHYENVYDTELSTSLSLQKKKKELLNWIETVKGKITQMLPKKISLEPALSSSASEAIRKRKEQSMCPKYQYYQNDSFVTVAILEPNLTSELLTAEYLGDDHLIVKVIKGNPDPIECTVICGTLFDSINVNKCKVVFKSEKVLVKLSKSKKLNWHELFSKSEKKGKKKVDSSDRKDEEEEKSSESKDDKQDDISPLTSKPAPTLEGKKHINRPYSSTKDWNKIEQNLKKDEESEKPEGDEALQKLFRDIYGKANSDTRRAMNKSFQTSGGTVLSTNWKEVKEKDYEKERTAPKGMEWKNWEGKKLPMKKDP